MKQEWQERLYRADDDELQRGYSRHDNACLFCNQRLTDPLSAGKHVQSIHGGVLAALLALDKSFTGLTDKQRALIALWHDKLPDQTLASESGVSLSTLRNQRFALRQREREARLFLNILKLSGLSVRHQPQSPKKDKNDIANLFRDGRLLRIPKGDAPRAAVMLHIANLFSPNVRYTDAQVRELLAPVHEDYALIRRYLVDSHLLSRTRDGRIYWRDAPSEEEQAMPFDRRAAKLAYKQTVTPMGVYCIRDTVSGRILLGSSTNVPSVNNHFRFAMRWGNDPHSPFSDAQLKQDYADHPDAFTFEILETVDQDKCESRAQAIEQLAQLYDLVQEQYASAAQYATKPFL